MGHLRDWPVLVVHSGSDECLTDPGSSIAGLQQRLASAIGTHPHQATNAQPQQDSTQTIQQQLHSGEDEGQLLRLGVAAAENDRAASVGGGGTFGHPTSGSTPGLAAHTGVKSGSGCNGGRQGFLHQEVIQGAGHQACGYEEQLADMVVRFVEKMKGNIQPQQPAAEKG